MSLINTTVQYYENKPFTLPLFTIPVGSFSASDQVIVRITMPYDRYNIGDIIFTKTDSSNFITRFTHNEWDIVADFVNINSFLDNIIYHPTTAWNEVDDEAIEFNLTITAINKDGDVIDTGTITLIGTKFEDAFYNTQAPIVGTNNAPNAYNCRSISMDWWQNLKLDPTYDTYIPDFTPFVDESYLIHYDAINYPENYVDLYDGNEYVKTVLRPRPNLLSATDNYSGSLQFKLEPFIYTHDDVNATGSSSRTGSTDLIDNNLILRDGTCAIWKLNRPNPDDVNIYGYIYKQYMDDLFHYYPLDIVIDEASESSKLVSSVGVPQYDRFDDYTYRIKATISNGRKKEERYLFLTPSNYTLLNVPQTVDVDDYMDGVSPAGDFRALDFTPLEIKATSLGVYKIKLILNPLVEDNSYIDFYMLPTEYEDRNILEEEYDGVNGYTVTIAGSLTEINEILSLMRIWVKEYYREELIKYDIELYRNNDELLLETHWKVNPIPIIQEESLSYSWTEDSTFNFTSPFIILKDFEDEILTLDLTLNGDVGELYLDHPLAYWDAGTLTLTIDVSSVIPVEDRISTINEILEDLQFIPLLNYDLDFIINATITYLEIIDTVERTIEQSITMTCNRVPDAPILEAKPDYLFDETILFNSNETNFDVSVSDVDTGDVLEYTGKILYNGVQSSVHGDLSIEKVIVNGVDLYVNASSQAAESMAIGHASTYKDFREIFNVGDTISISGWDNAVNNVTNVQVTHVAEKVVIVTNPDAVDENVGRDVDITRTPSCPTHTYNSITKELYLQGSLNQVNKDLANLTWTLPKLMVETDSSELIYGEPGLNYNTSGVGFTPATATINGTTVSFSTTTQGQSEYGQYIALEEDMAADINAAGISGVFAHTTGNKLYITSYIDDLVIDQTSAVADDNGNYFAGVDSGSGLSLGTTSTTTDKILKTHTLLLNHTVEDENDLSDTIDTLLSPFYVNFEVDRNWTEDITYSFPSNKLKIGFTSGTYIIKFTYNENVGELSTDSFTQSSGVLTITGTISEINDELYSLSFVPTTDYDQDFTISWEIIESPSTVLFSGSFDMICQAVSDVSLDDFEDTYEYLENPHFGIDMNFFESAPDISGFGTNQGTYTITLTLSDSSAGTIEGATLTSGAGVFTKTGTYSEVVTEITNLKFIPSDYYYSTFTIDVELTHGTGALQEIAEKTITLNCDELDYFNSSGIGLLYSYTEDQTFNSFVFNNIRVVQNSQGEETITTGHYTVYIQYPSDAGVLSTTNYTGSLGVLSFTDTVINVDNELQTLTFTPSAHYDEDFNIIIDEVSHNETSKTYGPFTINMIGIGIPDVDISGIEPSISYTEGQTYTFSNTTSVGTSTGDYTATLTLIDTLAGYLTTTNYTSTNGVLNFVGTYTEVNNELDSLEFEPNPYYNSDFTINVEVEHEGGDVDTFTINCYGTDVDDVQITGFEPAFSYIENQTYTFNNTSSISIFDDNYQCVLTLSDTSAGVLSTTNYTSTDGVLTITDTNTVIEEELDTLEFIPTDYYNSNFNILIQVRNLTTDFIDTQTINVTGINVPNISINSIQNSISLNEDTPFEFFYSSTFDAGGDGTGTYRYTFTVSNIPGTTTRYCSLNTSSHSQNASGILVVEGSYSYVNIEMDSLVLTPVTNYNGSFAINVQGHHIESGETHSKNILVTVNSITDIQVNNLNYSIEYYPNRSIYIYDENTPFEITSKGNLGDITLEVDFSYIHGTILYDYGSYNSGTRLWTYTNSDINLLNTAFRSILWTPYHYSNDGTIYIRVKGQWETKNGSITANGNLPKLQSDNLIISDTERYINYRYIDFDYNTNETMRVSITCNNEIENDFSGYDPSIDVLSSYPVNQENIVYTKQELDVGFRLIYESNNKLQILKFIDSLRCEDLEMPYYDIELTIPDDPYYTLTDTFTFEDNDYNMRRYTESTYFDVYKTFLTPDSEKVFIFKKNSSNHYLVVNEWDTDNNMNTIQYITDLSSNEYMSFKDLSFNQDGTTFVFLWESTQNLKGLVIYKWETNQYIRKQTINLGYISDEITSIKMSGDGRAIGIGIGNYNNDSTPPYIQIYNNWSDIDTFVVETNLIPSPSYANLKNNTRLYFSLNYNGDLCYISMPHYDDTVNGKTNSGCISVFKRSSTWYEDTILYPETPTTNNEFGKYLTQSPSGYVICCKDGDNIVKINYTITHTYNYKTLTPSYAVQHDSGSYDVDNFGNLFVASSIGWIYRYTSYITLYDVIKTLSPYDNQIHIQCNEHDRIVLTTFNGSSWETYTLIY